MTHADDGRRRQGARDRTLVGQRRKQGSRHARSLYFGQVEGTPRQEIQHAARLQPRGRAGWRVADQLQQREHLYVCVYTYICMHHITQLHVVCL